MRFKFILYFISSALLLSGCSTDQNLKEQTKLTEYKTCLETQGRVMASSDYPNNRNNAVEIALNFCAKYKP